MNNSDSHKKLITYGAIFAAPAPAELPLFGAGAAMQPQTDPSPVIRSEGVNDDVQD